MAKKLAGKKYAGSHGTVIDAAYDLIKSLERNEKINKISLGIIRQCKPGQGIKSIKINETQSGLELVVRGNIYVQTIYIYIEDCSSNRKEIAGIIHEKFLM